MYIIAGVFVDALFGLFRMGWVMDGAICYLLLATGYWILLQWLYFMELNMIKEHNRIKFF